MATQVEISSNALLMLGAQAISSLTEDTDRARLVNSLYGMVRDDLLRNHPWNSCIRRVSLAPEATPPAFGYPYAFVLPTDWLRTLAVGEDDDEVDYRHEGGRILSHENPLLLRYVANRPESFWDAGLVQCMTLALSARLAYPITLSSAREELAIRSFEIALKRAKAIDGQDDPPQTFGNLHLNTIRGG